MIFTDKYEIEAKLGAGGMCDVYRARHIRIGKEVAIKMLRPDYAADPKIVERFEREARAASLVRHPNAINIMDYGIAAGNTPFLVMELVEGATVRELLKRHGAMTLERVVGIVNQACAALEAAHAVGVIHRDIKPENIIVSEVDGRDWVEVVDFGIAKIQEDVSRRAALTGANLIIGTPRYMSPEQAQEKPVDARSDIYSLGLVVYEMLAGSPPFAGSSATRLLIAHAVEPPPPLTDQRPDLSPEVAAVVMRALEKDPERRQQSAIAFAREFESAANAERVTASHIKHRTLPAPISPPIVREDNSALPFESEEEDEATVVRRGSRKSNVDHEAKDMPPAISISSARESAKRERAARTTTADALAAHNQRKRLPVALLAGLLAVILIGLVVAYLGGRKRPSSERAATPQEIARAGATNSNVNVAEPANPSPTNPSPSAAPRTDEAPAVNPHASSKNENNGEATQPAPSVTTGKAVNEVRNAVSGWNAALQSRNLDAHMAYYAPRLHTYFLKENVDRNAARAEVAAALSRYSKLKIRTSPLAVSVDPTGNHAVVTYEKNWDFDGKEPWSGAAVERLWLERLNGRWRITGVRDLKQIR
jgi:serine/threonine protein kinase